MKKLKLPYGVSDYEKIALENYLYVDKTNYISLIEDNSDYLVLLRPRRFGKSLFISTLANYYDINKADKFDALFGNTYIGKHPTELKNSFCILEFDFSGLLTDTNELLHDSFSKSVKNSLYDFIEYYELTETVHLINHSEAAIILDDFCKQIKKNIKKPIYVLIDEYDQFANELLSFHTDIFSDVVSSNGFVRKFYEALKDGTKSGIIDRIFITGVTPFIIDSIINSVDIIKSITFDSKYNNIMGFNKDEVMHLLKTTIDKTIYSERSENILKEMQTNYDGYMFSKNATNTVYNSTICLYYLDYYIQFNKSRTNLLDINVASDVNLYNLFARKTISYKKEKLDILEKIVCTNKQQVTLQPLTDFWKKFDENNFLLLLYYLGYLTISGEKNDSFIMNIPNQIIETLYFELYFETLQEQYGFNTDPRELRESFEVMSEQGKNELLIENMEIILNAMSNRDFQGMSEQFVKSIAFTLSHFSDVYSVKSEYEVTNGYIDLAYLPKLGQELELDYYGIIEFKYIKIADYEKDPENQISEKRNAAYEQLMRYVKDPELAALDNAGKLKKWIIIFCKDKCVLNEEI